MAREKPVTDSYDPDPIVDVLTILSAVASIATIGSFVQGMISKGKPASERRKTLLSLDQSNSALRVHLNSLAEDYASIRQLQESPRRILGFRPAGLRMGAEVQLQADQIEKLLKLRKGIIRRSQRLQTLVVSIMQNLAKLGAEGQVPYSLYGNLEDRVNDILQSGDESLDSIEERLAVMLRETDRISAEVGSWLERQIGQ